MKKRMFFGFASFVGFSLLIAWQFAVAELAELQKDKDDPAQKGKTELVSSNSRASLFI